MAVPAPAAAAGAPPPDRRRGRWGRTASHGLVLVLGLVALLFVAGAILAHSFDPDAYKPRIEAAVLRATGRTLTIDGQLRIGLFNGPRIKATGVSLSNLAGGSRPEMARIAEVKARLSFTALLSGRIEITRLELLQPDIVLEITASGAPNWRFTPPLRPPAAATASDASVRPRRGIAVRELVITDGAAVLQDDRDGRRLALRLNRVTASVPAAGDPIAIALAATVGDTELRLNGSLGPAGGPAAEAATWPIKFDLAALGAKATLTGTVDAGMLPGGGAGDRAVAARYTLALAATVQNLANLAPLLPGVEVPPVKDLHLRLAVDGARGSLPALRQLDLSAGHSELGTVAPGLVLEQVSIVDPSAEAPLRARAAGSYAGTAFTLAADLGAPAALRPGGAAAAPFPISLSATAAGAHLTAKGSMQDPRALRGLDLAVAAQVPDVGAFAPLLHRPVPALQDFSLQARVTDGADGLRHGVTLEGLHVATPGSEASGTLRLAWMPRRAIAGQLVAASLNAGDLTSAFANPINPPPPPPAPPGTNTAAPVPPPAPPAAPRTLIPDRPIRFDRWTATDLDLALTARTVTWADEAWRNVAGHLLAGDGRLRLDSGAADLPAGHAEASFAVDTAPPVPTVALTLRAPGVSVQPLQALLGLPEALSGRLEVDANLHGTGRSPHEIAASADGTLGLAMVGGSLDGGDAQAWLAAVLRHAALPEGARLSGRTEIECFALRLDLAHGVGGFRALALQTPLLSLGGGGGVNFSDETLALRLRAVASVGIGIAVPFDVTGPLRAPQVRVNISSGAASALEGAAGLMIGRLGGDGTAALGGPSCGAELAAARGGWTGKLPVATAAPLRQAAPAAPGHPSDRATKVFRWLLP
jgi:AsmA protein